MDTLGNYRVFTGRWTRSIYPAGTNSKTTLAIDRLHFSNRVSFEVRVEFEPEQLSFVPSICASSLYFLHINLQAHFEQATV